jgi:four helix bundle protein
MTPDELKGRTKKFAIRIIKLVEYLDEDCGSAGKVIGKQILRSGTGVFSNYRAACRAKSARDFIHKLGTVVEEADETLGWLELLVGAEIVKLSLVEELLKEADEITAIMTSSRNSAIHNQKNKKNKKIGSE